MQLAYLLDFVGVGIKHSKSWPFILKHSFFADHEIGLKSDYGQFHREGKFFYQISNMNAWKSCIGIFLSLVSEIEFFR